MNINRHSKQIQQKLLGILDLPDDVVFDLPKITLIGDIQLYIENHRGIIEYTPKTRRIQLSIATPKVVKRPRRPDLSSFTAKWSCPWPMAA
ncbi:sporulation protein YqfC [Salmonella enterica subsp. enterica serovar Mbandaka]|nr:sporulation protein YqfC [Salmonella enterica subsp. enterica serovar Mbandaka]EED9866621.1 sporulation protein YqfC [Salmonella enterica subsp. enterica serovar Mbandaka]